MRLIIGCDNTRNGDTECNKCTLRIVCKHIGHLNDAKNLADRADEALHIECVHFDTDNEPHIGFIGTIKMVREKTGMGLKEAKKYVEDVIESGILVESEKASGCYVLPKL